MLQRMEKRDMTSGCTRIDDSGTPTAAWASSLGAPYAASSGARMRRDSFCTELVDTTGIAKIVSTL